MEKSEKNLMTFSDVSLRNTYHDYPEQYLAYIEDIPVGYMKVHLGKLVVSNIDHDTIFIARTDGIEGFDKCERESFIRKAKSAFILSMIYSNGRKDNKASDKYVFGIIQDVCEADLDELDDSISCYEILYEEYVKEWEW